MKKTKRKTTQAATSLTHQNEVAADLAPTESEIVAERVPIDSIKAAQLGVEYGSVLRELRHSVVQMTVHRLKSETLSEDEALAFALDPDPGKSTQEVLNRIERTPFESLSWWQISTLFGRDQQLAERVWQRIKQLAQNELASGHRMAETLESAVWQREPWKRAQFLAIRNGFVEEWRPRGGIELALIDMMAQSFNEYLFWSQEVHHRSTTDAKILYSREEERRIAEAQGHWLPPRVGERDATEHAMQMMDRYNRLFLRTLRQLRDLRRYSPPVTINNPQQVNIAAAGGQQVNAIKVEGD